MHLFLLSKKKHKKNTKNKNKKRSLFSVDNIARSNGVTIKDLNRLKTNTLVSATVSSGTGQLGIDYLTV